MSDASFELYDLHIDVAPEGAQLRCFAKVGDWFNLHGAVLPLRAAKQRVTTTPRAPS